MTEIISPSRASDSVIKAVRILAKRYQNKQEPCILVVSTGRSWYISQKTTPDNGYIPISDWIKGYIGVTS